MAHSGVQQDHHCKGCGLYFDSVKSLDVHVQYHKENLLIKWAAQPDETNNNNASSNKHRGSVTTAPADSSDGMMKTEPGHPSGSGSPQPSSFNHPPTPSSYSSAPSPFQDSSAQRFSPMASVGYSLNDRTPPHQQNGVLHPFNQQYSNFMTPSSDGSGYFMDGSRNSGYILGSGADFPSSSNVDNLRSSPNSVSSPSPSSSIGPVVTSTGMYRYHPYHQSQSSGSQLYVPDRNNGVTSSGPSPSSYQPPPTPQQCDKCGFVCNSSSALLEHLNNAHPPAPSPPFMNNQLQYQQETMFQNYHSSNQSPDTAAGGQQAAVAEKMKDEPAAEILDLDSHKVHQVYQPEEDATALRAAAGSDASNRGGNPHSVSAMLWGNTPHTNANPHATSSTTPQEFRVVTSPGVVTVHQQQMTYQKTGAYSQHLAPIPGQVIHPHLHHITSVPNISSSSLPPPGPMPSTSPHQHKNGPSMQQTSQQTGNQTWKSNEARRPKTYNCSACNKWFTSSGHLKRHYNTTLHKNAVKQSGAPDPATQPITNHHHPGRVATDVANTARRTPSGESHLSQQTTSGLGPQVPSVVEDSSRSDDASSNGNFGRITPSVQQGNLLPSGNQQQPTSPPNLMAGPSITMEAQMGGLHFLTSSYSSENNLLHNPSNSVHTSPVPAPQLPPEAVLHQLGTTQALSSQHPYMVGQVVSPPRSQPQSLPITHHLIHHPIPQHQPLHTSQHPTPLPSHQMTNVTEMYSPNVQPPHISILQEHHQVLPISINHLIPITGNCGSSGGSVSPLNLQADQQFLFPVTSSPQQDTQPLPSFAQIGHHPFGANSLAGFSGLTAATSSPSYRTVSTGPATEMTDNVGGLLNSDDQHLLVTKQSDVYNNNSNNNNLYWFNNFEDQNSLLDESSSKALMTHSNGSGDNGNVSINLSPNTANCHTSNISFDKPLKMVTHTTDARNEDDITSTGEEEITAMVANNNNINTANKNNRINKAKNSIFKSLSISSGDLHKCVDCDKVFNKACYLTQHNKSFHSGHKPYKCDRCGKRFMIEVTYEQHLAKHAGEKPYKCDVCPKQFNHKTDLRRHMCLHTGMKPFHCSICSKGFIRKDHMLKHCETHRRKVAHPHNGVQVVSAK